VLALALVVLVVLVVRVVAQKMRPTG
jgi:hypothetical protein